jgi:hypothetical protein
MKEPRNDKAVNVARSQPDSPVFPLASRPPMLQTFITGQLLRFGYRIRSLATNERQLRAATTDIERLVAPASEPVLRGRRSVPPLPGVTPVMQGWSAFMTIDHCNGVHEAMLAPIPKLEAGRSPEIGDLGRLDHPGDCGLEVMPRLRDLAARVAGLPQSHPFTGRGSCLQPKRVGRPMAFR